MVHAVVCSQHVAKLRGKCAVDTMSKLRPKRGRDAPTPADAPGTGDEPVKRAQKTVLGKVAADVGALFSNVRDILGKTDEEMTKAPNAQGAGTLDAVRQVAAVISTIKDMNLPNPVPDSKELRGWVQCCTFVETACRAHPDLVANRFEGLCQEGSTFLDGDVQVIALPLLRWTCNKLGIDANEEDDKESILARIAARSSGESEAAPAAAAVEFADAAIGGSSVDVLAMLRKEKEGEKSDSEETEGGAATERHVSASPRAGTSERQVPPEGASADVSFLVPHEEVAKAAGELQMVEFVPDAEAALMKKLDEMSEARLREVSQMAAEVVERLVPLLPADGSKKRRAPDSGECDEAFKKLLGTHGFDVHDVSFAGKSRQV